jgi:hypothetical protein
MFPQISCHSLSHVLMFGAWRTTIIMKHAQCRDGRNRELFPPCVQPPIYRVSGGSLLLTDVLALQPIPCDSRVGRTRPAKFLYTPITILQYKMSTTAVFTLPEVKTDPSFQWTSSPSSRISAWMSWIWVRQMQARGCITLGPRSAFAGNWCDFQSIQESTLEDVFQKRMDRLLQYCVSVRALVEGT